MDFLIQAQLEQLQDFLERKHEIFHQYQTSLNDVPGLELAGFPDYATNNHWINLLQIDSEIYGEDREKLMHRLEHKGIQTRPVWKLNHLQKPYRDCQSYKIENAEELVNNSLCLPSSTNLSDDEIHKVIDTLNG